MIARVEHVEATEREAITSGDGTRVVVSYTVTAIVEVTEVQTMGDAVRGVERRIVTPFRRDTGEVTR